jgi:tRNA threonylcarbamoyladenosine biosynthesis protein TsaE
MSHHHQTNNDSVLLIRYLTSIGETNRLAAAIAEVSDVGDLILLTGGIGSGKTAFVQAFAGALGVREPVTSPSFVLQNVYESGRATVSHVDLYRLASAAEVESLGIDDFADDSITLVEWADRYESFTPPYLELAFDLGARDEERIVTIRDIGGRWRNRLEPVLGELG